MILIAYDESDDAKHAIDEAAKLFGAADTTVVTVWQRMLDTLAHAGMDIGVVTDYATIDENTERNALATAQRGADLAVEAGMNAVAASTAVESTMAEAILHLAGEIDAAVIVLGTRGLSGVKSLVLGSTSHQVIHHADRPVLVVPSPIVSAERAARNE